MNDQDRIIDHRSDQNDEPQHREHIERLGDEKIQDPQTDNSADGTQRHAKNDDQRVKPGFEQRRHQQVRDQQRHQKVESQRFPSLTLFVCRSRERDEIFIADHTVID